MASTPGGVVMRGEMFKLAYAVATGNSPTAAGCETSAYSHCFGVVQTATLPDPSVETFPIYALGTNSNRNAFVTYMGKITLSGSIPDIWLLDGSTLGLAIGTDVCTATAAPYTHLLQEQCGGTIPMISIHATQMKSNCTGTPLMRRWYGGKVNRMTIEATEGDFLKAGIDEIVFSEIWTNVTGEAGSPVTAYYSASIADCTAMTYPTAQPYLFSYGKLYLGVGDPQASTEFARIRNFRLEINNNLEPKYYIQNQSGFEGRRLPYEYREGRREYRLSMQVDLEDEALYREILRFGTYNQIYSGFSWYAKFTRGTNDYIELYSPATGGATATPSGGGDKQGCLIRTAPHNIMTDPIVSTTLDIQMRNLGATVKDSLPDYGY